MTTVWAVGDGATGGADAARLAAFIQSQKPDCFAWLGDVYESGTAAEFAANYAPSWGQLDPVCYPIPGNHDWGNYETGYKPYFAAAGREALPNYDRTFGSWRVWMLNSEDVASAVAYVKAAPPPVGRRNIACWHRPRYCSGSHGDAEDTAPLWELLAPHCPVILGGHAHNMQHFKPDATGCSQLVSGAGGRSLYAEVPDDERLAWGNASGYGAVRLALGDVSIGVTWFDEFGSQLYDASVAL